MGAATTDPLFPTAPPKLIACIELASLFLVITHENKTYIPFSLLVVSIRLR